MSLGVVQAVHPSASQLSALWALSCPLSKCGTLPPESCFFSLICSLDSFMGKCLPWHQEWALQSSPLSRQGQVMGWQAAERDGAVSPTVILVGLLRYAQLLERLGPSLLNTLGLATGWVCAAGLTMVGNFQVSHILKGSWGVLR